METILEILSKVDLPLVRMDTVEDSEADNKGLEDTVGDSSNNNNREVTGEKIVDPVHSEEDPREGTVNSHHREEATVNSNSSKVTEVDTKNREEGHKVDSTIEVRLVYLLLPLLPLLPLQRKKQLLVRGRGKVAGDRNKRTLRCQ